MVPAFFVGVNDMRKEGELLLFQAIIIWTIGAIPWTFAVLVCSFIFKTPTSKLLEEIEELDKELENDTSEKWY